MVWERSHYQPTIRSVLSAPIPRNPPGSSPEYQSTNYLQWFKKAFWPHLAKHLHNGVASVFFFAKNKMAAVQGSQPSRVKYLTILSYLKFVLDVREAPINNCRNWANESVYTTWTQEVAPAAKNAKQIINQMFVGSRVQFLLKVFCHSFK